MILVVGLGNPGLAYQNTRHNAGFILLDDFVKGDFKEDKNFKGKVLVSKGVVFLKPSTFMNLSGESVSSVKNYYKCDQVIVVHDDIDLKLGALRFKKAGSSGGHNGLKSIDKHIGKDYTRVRIGIGKKDDVSKHVLSKFDALELQSLEAVFQNAKSALSELLKQDDLAMIQAKYSLKPDR